MVKEVKIQIHIKMYYTRKNTSSIRNSIGYLLPKNVYRNARRCLGVTLTLCNNTTKEKG